MAAAAWLFQCCVPGSRLISFRPTTPIADRVFNGTLVGKGSYSAKYKNSASGLGTSVSYRF
jgi:hypothetical protein